MSPTEQASEAGYHALWNRAQIRPARESQARTQASRVASYKSRFLIVEKATGVPWEFVGLVTLRESDLNFHATLSDGEPIIGTGRTTRMVPAGRGPFATFEESAVDELKTRRHLDKIIRWSVERTLFELEGYNGWGYLGKCNSPYVWSWTQLYGPPESAGGKYVSDHNWNSTVTDTQPGCVAILKELMLIDPSTAIRFSDNNREPKPQPGAIDDHKKKATAKSRNIAKGAAGAGTVGTASEAGKAKSGIAPIPSELSFVLIGIGVIVAVIAVALTIRTGNLLKARW